MSKQLRAWRAPLREETEPMKRTLTALAVATVLASPAFAA